MADNIGEFESRVTAERERLLQVRQSIASPQLKRTLQIGFNLLDDIESCYLRSAREDQRTPQALNCWLEYAENLFRVAVMHRELVEGTVRKYGPGATVVG